MWGLLKFPDQMNQHFEMLSSRFVVFTEKYMISFFILKRKILATHVPINIADSWFFCWRKQFRCIQGSRREKQTIHLKVSKATSSLRKEV